MLGTLNHTAERLFDFPQIGALDPDEAELAIVKPARDVKAASTDLIAALDESFFRVRFGRLTSKEKHYLRAMAELGPGPHRSGDIDTILKKTTNSLGPLRASLIVKA